MRDFHARSRRFLGIVTTGRTSFSQAETNLHSAVANEKTAPDTDHKAPKSHGTMNWRNVMNRYQLANAAMSASMGMSAGGAPVLLEVRHPVYVSNGPLRRQPLDDPEAVALAAEIAGTAARTLVTPMAWLTAVFRKASPARTP